MTWGHLGESGIIIKIDVVFYFFFFFCLLFLNVV